MWRSLFRLRTFVRPYWHWLTAGITAFFVARILEAQVPIFLAMGIDRLAALEEAPSLDALIAADLRTPIIGIVVAVLARYGVVTFARFMVRRTALHVAFDLRQRLFGILQSQGARFFNDYSIGDMMTRAVADISLIQRLFALGTVLVVILIFATIVSFGYMFYLAPSLTLLLIPPLPFVYFYARWSTHKTGIASQAVQEGLSTLSDQVQENLSGIRTIQAMVQEDNEIRRFAGTNDTYAQAFYRQERISSLTAAVMPTLAGISQITILGYGGWMVLEGQMTTGTFVAFFFYVRMALQPVRVAGFIVNLFQRAAIASDRLFEVMHLEPEIPDTPSGQTPATIRGAIELNNLHFRYPKASTNALDGIDLTVKEGEAITIMGPVGCGKSTLLRLLVRLLEPEPNAVLIDGFAARDYPLKQLRLDIALVPQDPFLFGQSLGANITYDQPDRPPSAIRSAADAADLGRTLERFPEGLDTPVGERGVTLSGGQKQRATLARGLIRNAPVLLLDDCFSSVDTETEDRILSALRRLRRGKTTILVSHRVSTARTSDRIVMLDQGRIVELGSHDELLRRGGAYAELERLQREGDSSPQVKDPAELPT
ncbi:MAG: ABC transporter ATP-binding protein [Pseudomonadota bacterium]